MKVKALVLFALIAGCSSSVGPDRTRLLGVIAGYNLDDPRIEIVAASKVVTVRVTTYGGGCHVQGETSVDVSGMAVVITPYDYLVTPDGGGCTRQLVSFTHEANITFPNSGEATITVHGRDHRSGASGPSDGTMLDVEFAVPISGN